MRRILLTLIACAFVSLAGSARVSSAAEEKSPRRGVVLIIGDDLGLQLNCYGDETVRTPHIDALAARGTRFTHSFATVASCSPSRAVLLTGLYTHTNGQYGLAHAEHNVHTLASVKSLPKRLKEAGWRTGVIGKLHVLPPAVYPFDENVSGRQVGNGRDPEAMADALGKFIAKDDKPFFAVVGFTDPHRGGKGFANEQWGLKDGSDRVEPAKVKVPAFLPDKDDVRRDLADYYQSVARLDRGVGRVLDEIEKSGAANETLVVFLSDNGIPFPGAKTTLYDAGVRLPLIVASPRQTKLGHANDSMASWVDVAPTVLEWAGLPPDALPGQSLLKLLDAEHASAGARDAVFGSHVQHEVTMYYPMRSVRTRTHKYILNLAHELEFPAAQDLFASPTWQGVLRRKEPMLGGRALEVYLHRKREELYDLERDPHELNNVAGEAAYAGVLTELRQRMKQWQTETNDPWLVKYEHE